MIAGIVAGTLGNFFVENLVPLGLDTSNGLYRLAERHRFSYGPPALGEVPYLDVLKVWEVVQDGTEIKIGIVEEELTTIHTLPTDSRGNPILLNNISLSFDQNGFPLLVWEYGKEIFLRWYDPLSQEIEVRNLGAGISPFIALETFNERIKPDRTVLLCYVRDGKLVHRHQNDRFDEVFDIADNVKDIIGFGKTDYNNLKIVYVTENDITDEFEVQFISTNRLGIFEADLLSAREVSGTLDSVEFSDSRFMVDFSEAPPNPYVENSTSSIEITKVYETVDIDDDLLTEAPANPYVNNASSLMFMKLDFYPITEVVNELEVSAEILSLNVWPSSITISPSEYVPDIDVSCNINNLTVSISTPDPYLDRYWNRWNQFETGTGIVLSPNRRLAYSSVPNTSIAKSVQVISHDSDTINSIEILEEWTGDFSFGLCVVSADVDSPLSSELWVVNSNGTAVYDGNSQSIPSLVVGDIVDLVLNYVTGEVELKINGVSEGIIWSIPLYAIENGMKLFSSPKSSTAKISLNRINIDAGNQGGELWTPANIEESLLSLWLDASDEATVITSEEMVSGWNDKSIHSRNFTQSNINSRPERVADGIKFSNVNDTATLVSGLEYTGDGIIATRPTEVFSIVDSVTKGGALLSSLESLTRYGYAGYNGSVYRTNANAVIYAPDVTDYYADGERNMPESRYENNDDLRFRINAEEYFISTTNSMNLTSSEMTTYLGHYRPPSFSYPGSTFGGIIREIVVINGTLSSGDREKIQGYLAHKWNIQSKLPPSHPYSIEPPKAVPVLLPDNILRFDLAEVAGVTNAPVNGYEEFHGKRYISTANCVARINPDYSLERLAAFPILNGSTATYNGLFAFDNDKMIVNNTRAVSGVIDKLYMDVNEDSQIAVANCTQAYLGNEVAVYDNIMCGGRSVGSNSGDGWWFIPYNEVGNGANGSPTKILNVVANSGRGQCIVKYNNKFYLSGSNTSYIGIMDALDISEDIVASDTLLVSAGSMALTTDGTYLIAANENGGFGTNTNALQFSVYDGVEWILKDFPNSYECMYLSKPRSSSSIFAILRNTLSPTELHIFKWDASLQDFVQHIEFPSMTSIDPNMTAIAIRYVSRWYADKIYMTGAATISGQTKPLVITCSSSSLPPTYSSIIMKSNPLMHYPLNEISGTTAYDISGHNRNLTIYPNAVLDATPIIDDMNYSASAYFSGELDSKIGGIMDASIPAIIAPASSEYTIGVMFRMAANGGTIWHFGNNTLQGQPGIGVGITGTNQIRINYLKSDGYWQQYDSLLSVELGENYLLHIVKTSDGVFNLYLNDANEILGEQTHDVQYSTTGREFTLGLRRAAAGQNVDSGFYAGYIQHFTLNAFAMSEEEIQERYINFSINQ